MDERYVNALVNIIARERDQARAVANQYEAQLAIATEDLAAAQKTIAELKPVTKEVPAEPTAPAEVPPVAPTEAEPAT